MKKLIILILFFQFSIFSEVKILSPKSGFTTSRIIEVSGKINTPKIKKAVLIVNGSAQPIQVYGGRFSTKILSSPGNNSIEVKSGSDSDSVHFFAKVPPKDIKIVLTWDTGTDVDLWVIDPTGEKTFYGNKSSPNGGNLDLDVVNGYGPETFTMAKAMAGTYTVNVQYYSSYSTPITKAKVQVILYEGTNKEEKKVFDFVMTKSGEIYNLAKFHIDAE